MGTAGVAQLVEQLICNQQVGGSNPSTSSTISYGGIPERPNGADCKSVVTDFGGSNPPSPTKAEPDEPDAFAWLFCVSSNLHGRRRVCPRVLSCARIENEHLPFSEDGQVLFSTFFHNVSRYNLTIP